MTMEGMMTADGGAVGVSLLRMAAVMVVEEAFLKQKHYQNFRYLGRYVLNSKLSFILRKQINHHSCETTVNTSGLSSKHSILTSTFTYINFICKNFILLVKFIHKREC